MDQKELEKLVILKKAYTKATYVCPPDEYNLNLRKLLIAIADHLLEPLNEIEKAKAIEQAEAIDKMFDIENIRKKTRRKTKGS